MLLQETLTAVMVAENTVVSKFVLSDTSYVLPERTKMSGHCPEGKKGEKRSDSADRRLEVGGERTRRLKQLPALAREERMPHARGRTGCPVISRLRVPRWRR